jgi:hypothetical protein
MNARYYEKESPRMLTMLTLLVVAAGAATIAVAAARQAFQSEYAWLSMIGLALFVGPVSTVYIPGVKARVVLGDVVTFTCAALFGPSAAIIAAVADGAVTSLKITSDIRKFSYNVATCAVSMAVSNLATRAAFPSFGVKAAGLSVIELLAAMGLFTLCYFLGPDCLSSCGEVWLLRYFRSRGDDDADLPLLPKLLHEGGKRQQEGRQYGGTQLPHYRDYNRVRRGGRLRDEDERQASRASHG